LSTHHNLLGSVNEAHFLVDDAGRAHLDKVIRGETLGQVLSDAGYDPAALQDKFREAVRSAEAQSKMSPEEGSGLRDNFRASLEGYTYLED
jgi:arginine decarboxylase